MNINLSVDDSAIAPIQIVGVGLNPWNDASLSAIRAIRSAGVLFCAEFHREFVNAFKSQRATINLVADHLETERSRIHSYRVAARRIFDAAANIESVVWVTAGDPTVNCGVTNELLALCANQTIPVTLISGVTAFTAVNALIPQADRSNSFMQMNATDLFLVDLIIDVRLTLFVIQIFQHVSPRTMPSLLLRPDILQPLQQRLLDFYPPDHKCHLVAAGTSFNAASCQTLEIASLVSSSTRVSPESTLVIPALSSRDSSYTESLHKMWMLSDELKCVSLLEHLALIQNRN